MTYHTDTLDQIQRLSNERQGLWRQKWPKRTKEGYQERIRQIDNALKRLWDVHRSEVAGQLHHYRPQHGISPEITTDYIESRGGHVAATGTQVLIDGNWRTVSDDRLTQAINRYAMDIPIDYSAEIHRLSVTDLLQRRGKSLSWEHWRRQVDAVG